MFYMDNLNMDNLNNQLYINIFYDIHKKIDLQLRHQIGIQVKNQLSSQLYGQISDPTFNLVNDNLEKVWSQIRDQLYSDKTTST